MEQNLPILDHALDEPSAFTASGLMDAVRQRRGITLQSVPPLCILEFDGDLTDWLVSQGIARRDPSWACFHTTMYSLDLDGLPCGIIGRTIGGPYAVLIAEQLHSAGVQLIVGLTSAGRISPELPLPCLVVASSAVRDEGTSYHYLPPSPEVQCPSAVTAHFENALGSVGWPVVTGRVWTTDAPYRETSAQLEKWAARDVLAVEMQAASLFAFAAARNANVAVIAMVSNAVDHEGDQFDTGTERDGYRVLQAIGKSAASFFNTKT